MRRLGIIADDLTGAMDTGVQFAKYGLHTAVALTEDCVLQADVVVLSTDSRALRPTEANERVRAAAARLAGRSVYKKIDSTMRGNVGAEIDGLLDSLDYERALVAPSFPSAGRTVEDGRLLVHGIPLEQSSFARDPLCPARESHVPGLVARQTRRAVGHLPLSLVHQGPCAINQAFAECREPIVVADAIDQEQLGGLAVALVSADVAWLPCGSAGLAQEWLWALGVPKVSPVPWPADDRPVLVVAGTRHPATQRQLRRAEQQGELELVHANHERAVIQRAVALLRGGRNVALTSAFRSYRVGPADDIAVGLAQVAAQVLEEAPVSGLVLTGGDTARCVCSALGATALRIVDEVQPGVPAGLSSGGGELRRIVTKAGGLGGDDAVVESIRYIQGR